MSPPIQGIPINRFYKSTITTERIKLIENESSKKKATQMGLLDKITDWICKTKKNEILNHLHDLLHNNKSDTVSVVQKINSYYQLSTIINDGFKARLKAEMKSNENNTWIFAFSIESVLEHHQTVYGLPAEDFNLFIKNELTNGSGFLEEENIKKYGIDGALEKTSYINDINSGKLYLRGITESNQNRLGIDKLDERTKQCFLTDPGLVQTWIKQYMQCFDYYADQRAFLEKILHAVISEDRNIEIQNHYIYQAMTSINNIQENTIIYMAEIFNAKTIGYYTQNYSMAYPVVSNEFPTS